MSDSYSQGQSAGFGGNLVDLVSTQKGLSQTVSRGIQGITNAFPPATASSSPNATGFSLGSTVTVLVATNPARHGIIFHVPSTTASVLVWPSNMTPAPSTASPGGALLISTTMALPSSQFCNINCGFSGINSTTSGSAPFTVWEFY